MNSIENAAFCQDTMYQHLPSDMQLRLQSLPLDEQAWITEKLRLLGTGVLQNLQKIIPEEPSLSPRHLGKCRPPEIIDIGKTSPVSERARNRGIEALKGGNVGVLIVAGGEGTRLGFGGPKGCFPLDATTGATLFEVYLRKITAAAERWQANCHVYVMTSPSTDAATREFLEEKEWFGIPDEFRHLFCQKTMPVFEIATGNLLLNGCDRVCRSPDGHGGVLSALRQAELIKQMRMNSVETIFYCQIDNPRTPVLDEEIIGYHLLTKSELTVVTVEKTTPDESVGTVVTFDGRLQIFEYGAIPDGVAQARCQTGELLYNAANTGIHVFSTDFLAETVEFSEHLPWHMVRKVAAFRNAQGEFIRPRTPNAIKLERLLFDAFPRAKRWRVLGTDAARAFAPVKTAGDTDAIMTAAAIAHSFRLR